MAISYKNLHTTLITLANAQVCELVVEDVIFANAINNNFKTSKAFETFVKDCKAAFSYRRNHLKTEQLIKEKGIIDWATRERSVRLPHMAFMCRRYPDYVRAYFRQQGFLSHMVRDNEVI